ncbi:B12-binding domain-containing radical SAM protein [bacterium]|nr:B12-binding domain-containing radical SAM protein [candidate division CSSED10-310 bacterium]
MRRLNANRVAEQKRFIDDMSRGNGCRISIVSLYNTENTSIRYFIPMLKRAGHQVQVIYFRDYYVNDACVHTETDERLFIEVMTAFRPDLVAFSIGSSTFCHVGERLTRCVREHIDTRILWGGVHAMVTPDEAIQHADMVCLGEGELALLELARAIADKRPVDSIRNLWVRTPDGIKQNPTRPPLEDLDILPVPDYSDENKFFIKNALIPGDPTRDVTWQYLAQASRGCPFSCSFCMNSVLKPIFTGRTLRRRSVDSILAELQAVLKQLPNVGALFFIDEVFMVDADWIDEFASKYPQTVHLPFGVYNTPGLTEDYLLKKLKTAGLFEVEVGIQSGSDRIRKDVFHRSATNAQILSASRAAHRYGIDLKFDLIFDNPFETDDDRKDLFELLMQIPAPFEFSSFSLVWFPRVPLTAMALQQGIITENDIEDRSNKAFTQWAVSLEYPRPVNELYWITLCMLTGKPWIPPRLVRWLSHREAIRRKPQILQPLLRFNTLLRWVLKGIPVLFRGQVPWAIIRKRWRYMIMAMK